ECVSGFDPVQQISRIGFTQMLSTSERKVAILFLHEDEQAAMVRGIHQPREGRGSPAKLFQFARDRGEAVGLLGINRVVGHPDAVSRAKAENVRRRGCEADEKTDHQRPRNKTGHAFTSVRTCSARSRHAPYSRSSQARSPYHFWSNIPVKLTNAGWT